MEYLIKKAIENVLEKIAINKEHQRLQNDLENWATENGFTELVEKYFDGKIRPDVVRYNPIDKLILIGDAKDSNNETANRIQTIARIISYIKSFVNSIDNKFIVGGIIAISTNDESKANEWPTILKEICSIFNVVNMNETPASFKIEHYQDNTWIIR